MPTDQSPPALPPDRSIPSAVFDRFEGLFDICKREG